VKPSRAAAAKRSRNGNSVYKPGQVGGKLRERLRRLDRQLAALEAELRSCDVANAPRLVLDCPAAGLGAA
jgi:hypothetical protein